MAILSMFKFKNLANGLTYVTKGKDLFECYDKANKISGVNDREDLGFFVRSEMYSESYYKFLEKTDIIEE